MDRKRILIGVAIIVVVSGVILGVEAIRRRRVAELPPGAVPIYRDGRFVAAFVPEDLEQLSGASFTDAEEGKLQEGWLLRDVLRLYLDGASIEPDTAVVVGSSSRDKSVRLTWREVDDPANGVLFDLSSRGTLKLASLLEQLDTRDEWVQDVDRIDLESAD
ncbi:MAG: hypothetical protein JXA09_17075 [Anaerolineae bacterium]|nr:hypothetical protein [Anaerolineae bacterium]